jgi:hypothetical protein
MLETSYSDLEGEDDIYIMKQLLNISDSNVIGGSAIELTSMDGSNSNRKTFSKTDYVINPFYKESPDESSIT